MDKNDKFIQKEKMKYFGFIFIYLILLILGSGPIMAAEGGFSLVTSPLPINLVTSPGSTVSAQLKVKNGGSQNEDLEVGIMKFEAFGDEGLPRLIDREKGDDYFDWVTFSENNFMVAPNEWKTITMNINVPTSAAFGYYYAVTFSRKDDSLVVGARSTKIVGASAVLVLLEARVPQAIREVEVTNFEVNQKVYEFLPSTFSLNLKNSGNVHVAPRGNIFIDSGNKKDLAILEVNNLKGSILPSSSRVFEVEWTDGFPIYETKTAEKVMETDRTGKEVKKLKWDFSQVQKFRIGKYSASMLLTYDDGQKDVPIEAKVSFWVIPWRLMFGLAIILLLLILGIYVLVYVFLKLFRKSKK